MRKVAIALLLMAASWQIHQLWSSLSSKPQSKYSSALSEPSFDSETENQISEETAASSSEAEMSTSSATTVPALESDESEADKMRALNALLSEAEYTSAMGNEIRRYEIPSGTEVSRDWDDEVEVIKERTDDGSTVQLRIRLDGNIESEAFRRWTGEEISRTYDPEGNLILIMHRKDNGVTHVQEFFTNGRIRKEMTEVNGDILRIEYDATGKVAAKAAEIQGQKVESF